MELNGRDYQRNLKFLRATSELPNTTFENTTEETLETMKYNIENLAVAQSPRGSLVYKRCTAGAEES